MTFEEWITKTYKCHKFDPWTVDDCYKAWDAGYHQAIQDIIEYAEHMGDVEKFARQHGIRGARVMPKYQPVTREELKKFVGDNELVQMETSYIGEPPVTLFMNNLGERPAKVVHYEDYGEPTMYYIWKEQE